MQEQLDKCVEMFDEMKDDAEKQIEKGNKTAGRRVRVASNKLRSELKTLKELSMKLEKSGG